MFQRMAVQFSLTPQGRYQSFIQVPDEDLLHLLAASRYRL
jgi:hypothetical protein